MRILDGWEWMVDDLRKTRHRTSQDTYTHSRPVPFLPTSFLHNTQHEDDPTRLRIEILFSPGVTAPPSPVAGRYVRKKNYI